MKRIFLFNTGHPNWRKVCKANNFKFKQIVSSGLISSILKSFLLALFEEKQHSLYVCAGVRPVFYPMFKRLFGEKNEIFVIANDASFYFKERSRLIESFYDTFVFKQIDGVVAISPLVETMANKYGIPTTYLPDPIWRGHNYFNKNRVDKTSLDFIHVGKPLLIKGMDLTAKTMSLVNVELNTQSYVLGEGIKEFLSSLGLYHHSFICPGYKDPMLYFNRVRFYIQIARLEAGGTAVLEAMAAGIIPFVNDAVGHSNIVSKVDKRLIVSSDPNLASQQIIRFIRKTPNHELTKISEKCKQITKQNNLSMISKRFGELWIL